MWSSSNYRNNNNNNNTPETPRETYTGNLSEFLATSGTLIIIIIIIIIIINLYSSVRS